MDARLTRLERKLEQVSTGLGVLGVKPCTLCGTFYQSHDPGTLFHFSELVCFDCVAGWWSRRAPEFSDEDRQKAQRELSHWLIAHHDAKVIGRPEDLPESERILMKLVTGCEICDESGKVYTGRGCHNCHGRGTVWVVVSAANASSPSERTPATSRSDGHGSGE